MILLQVEWNTITDRGFTYEQFENVFNSIEFVSFLFVIVLLIEAVYDILIARKRKPGETLSNLGTFAIGTILEALLTGLVFVFGLYFVKTLIPYTIPSTWWSWVLAILAADFTYYWMHRWEHEVRFLWGFHNVHHSSPEYNLTTNVRLSWFSAFVEWLFFIPMMIVGFGVLQTLVAISIVNTYQIWIHTEKIGKLGWLDKILNTPSTHRVHHGSNRQYWDKNYGGILIIWDRLFGTYEPEVEKVRYGLSKPVNSLNPIYINLHEFINMYKDVSKARNWKERWNYVFGKTGWRPKGTKSNTDSLS